MEAAAGMRCLSHGSETEKLKCQVLHSGYPGSLWVQVCDGSGELAEAGALEACCSGSLQRERRLSALAEGRPAWPKSALCALKRGGWG